MHEARARGTPVRAHLQLARCCLTSLALLLAACLFYSPTDNNRWDPSFYYAQMRAPLIDRDLDIADEVTPPDAIRARTARGLVPSPWPIAPGVLWSPFFLLAHLVSLAIGAPSDGRAPIYYAFVTAGSALFGFAGLFATDRAARWVSGSSKLIPGLSLASLATFLTLFATPLFFYLFRQPVMAHTTGFWATAMLVWALVLVETRRLPVRYSGLVVGAFLGVAITVRRIGVVMALIPAFYGGYYLLLAWRAGDRGRLRLLLRQALLLLSAATVALLPQLAYYAQMFGALGLHPTGDFGGSALPVHLVDLLIGTNRGLLFWLPLALLGFVGLLRLPSRALRVAFIGFVVVYLYGIASWRDWYGGGGFGARYFIEILPVIILGFVALARPFTRSVVGRAAILIAALFMIFQQLTLVVSAEQGWLPPEYSQGQSLSTDFQSAQMRRLLVEPQWWVAPRASVLPERQSALVTLLSETRRSGLFLFPVVAAVLWLVFSPLVRRSTDPQWLAPLSTGLLLFMLIWGAWLLAIP